MNPTLNQLKDAAETASKVAKAAYEVYKSAESLWMQAGLAERKADSLVCAAERTVEQ